MADKFKLEFSPGLVKNITSYLKDAIKKEKKGTSGIYSGIYIFPFSLGYHVRII